MANRKNRSSYSHKIPTICKIIYQIRGMDIVAFFGGCQLGIHRNMEMIESQCVGCDGCFYSYPEYAREKRDEAIKERGGYYRNK